MKRLSRICIAFAFLVVLGCAGLERGLHRYLMRGSVVSANGQIVVVCLGKVHGAEPGQVLTVHRGIVEGPLDASSYRWVKVGSVQITEVFDAHFARARIQSGAVERGDIVELPE